jgi:hypothetical protein
MARIGRAAQYVAASGADPVDCRIIFDFAGTEDVVHGTQRRAVIKVLAADFPSVPTGRFVVEGEQWQCLEQLGKADGHRHGVQWAVLAGNARAFSAGR